MTLPPDPAARAVEPSVERGHHVWRTTLHDWRILCRGRPVDPAVHAVDDGPETGVEVARLRQVHSDRVVPARPGPCGEGDALLVDRARLAATVVTADCVPVVIAGQRAATAVHAGWRGIAASLVPKAIERLRATGEEELLAWIGPAIGGCCYEVGEDVADLVVRATTADARLARVPEGSPHLDLRRAVRAQVESGGARIKGELALCTRCHPEWLWSYRRDGPGGGRIETFVWKE